MVQCYYDAINIVIKMVKQNKKQTKEVIMKLELFHEETIIPPHLNTSSWDRSFEMDGFNGIIVFF